MNEFIEPVYNDFVRQWGLSDAGRAVCVADAISSGDPGAMAALQRWQAVKTLVDLARPYEAAKAIVDRGQPDNGQPKQIPDPAWIDPGDGSIAPMIDNPAWALQPTEIDATDDSGKPINTPNPLWTAYDAASAMIKSASDTTRAHALWRSGEPAQGAPEHDAWASARSATQAALEKLAGQAIANDPRPVPKQITLWQARAVLTVSGKFAMADAALRASGNVAAIALWDYGNTIDRDSPTLGALAAAIGLTSSDMDQLFIRGGAMSL
jgi:hypothetical protein